MKLKDTLQKIDWRVACIAIGCITVLECLAILKGIDGVMFSVALMSIAGIAGFELKKFLK